MISVIINRLIKLILYLSIIIILFLKFVLITKIVVTKIIVGNIFVDMSSSFGFNEIMYMKIIIRPPVYVIIINNINQ